MRGDFLNHEANDIIRKIDNTLMPNRMEMRSARVNQARLFQGFGPYPTIGIKP